MSKLTIELPESLRKLVADLAAKEGYSIDQFFASAAAEKIAAVRTLDYLRNEAAAGRREDFERYLSAVPHRAPESTDRLP